jgi:thioesterase domain-containing protein
MAKPPIIIPITAAEKPIASVFLLHDVTGSTSAYEKDGFLEKFQGYTFFSVCQNDSSFSEDETLASLSEAYAKAIIEACPAGPYHLIGYSFGGILAIEVAQHLSEKRKEIGTITIVDTPPLERFIAAEYNIFLNFLLKLEVCLLNTDGFIKTIDEKEEEEDKTLLLERFFDYCSTQIRYGARRHQQEQQIKLLKYIRANLGLLFSSVQTPFSRSSFQNKVQLLSCQDTCQQYGLNSMLGWDEFGLNPNEKTCINLPKIDHFNLFSHEDSLTSLASAIKKKIRADKRDVYFKN